MVVPPTDIKERNTAKTLDVERVRAEFPILTQRVNGRPLAYLDNAATTQKPQAVIDAITGYYRESNANIHRGVHQLSMRATDGYEAARQKVQRFIGAERPEEVVFVRGTTEAINLVAQTYGRSHVGEGDEVLITGMEHHSNIVPWQILCGQVGARLLVAPIDNNGEVILEEFERLLGPRTKLAALIYVSNALGTVNPVREMVAAAHERGVPVLVDGAQATPHLAVDVRSLDCDFFAFSGHKTFGPTGVGALFGKYEILDRLPPYQGGGDMIKHVTFEKTTYNDLPHKYEAGTPNIAGAIGLGAAVDFLNEIGLDRIAAHEKELLAYATEALTSVDGVRVMGTAREKASVLSFLVRDIHAHDVGTILDQHGVAIRTGHHCAQPVMDHFGVPATARASLALYNTREDIDALVEGVGEVAKVFG
jgi:cysteine desulfurase/selenocysteine lyase